MAAHLVYSINIKSNQVTCHNTKFTRQLYFLLSTYNLDSSSPFKINISYHGFFTGATAENLPDLFRGESGIGHQDSIVG